MAYNPELIHKLKIDNDMRKSILTGWTTNIPHLWAVDVAAAGTDTTVVHTITGLYGSRTVVAGNVVDMRQRPDGTWELP
jgi:ethanolamine utilization microcompartment shell protein EutL